jgi:D-lactate dehydrogenase (cytochrome)
MALAAVKDIARNDAAVSQVSATVRALIGDRLQTGEAIRRQHAHTTTYIPTQAPDAVAFVRSEGEVQAIVTACYVNGVPVIPFGAGSSLEGHVNAPGGGICLDMTGMDKVVAVHTEDLDCVIEPGITRQALNTHLRDTGLFFPIDPGANATLGGMASTRASGTNAVRYGTMRDNVIALRAVMPDGRIIQTGGRARKSSAGYDLGRLLIGAEGTLGVITQMTLRLQGIPQAISGGVCPFPSVQQACDAVIATIQMGVPVARIEFVNALGMQSINRYSKLNYEEGPCLFLEFHGSEAGVAEQADTFGEIAAEYGGGPFHWTNVAEERARLWQARHDAYWAAVALKPGWQALSTDVCVPISRLAECIVATEADIAEHGLVAPIVGHVGDGNFHVLVLMEPGNQAHVAGAEGFVERLNARALAMDGTCTGEHGIGQGKIAFLEREAGEALDVMKAVKAALDPRGIMNPGKLFA